MTSYNSSPSQIVKMQTCSFPVQSPAGAYYTTCFACSRLDLFCALSLQWRLHFWCISSPALCRRCKDTKWQERPPEVFSGRFRPVCQFVIRTGTAISRDHTQVLIYDWGLSLRCKQTHVRDDNCDGLEINEKGLKFWKWKTRSWNSNFKNDFQIERRPTRV